MYTYKTKRSSQDFNLDQSDAVLNMNLKEDGGGKEERMVREEESRQEKWS